MTHRHHCTHSVFGKHPPWPGRLLRQWLTLLWCSIPKPDLWYESPLPAGDSDIRVTHNRVRPNHCYIAPVRGFPLLCVLYEQPYRSRMPERNTINVHSWKHKEILGDCKSTLGNLTMFKTGKPFQCSCSQVLKSELAINGASVLVLCLPFFCSGGMQIHTHTALLYYSCVCTFLSGLLDN